jgi:hypothetical protein
MPVILAERREILYEHGFHSFLAAVIASLDVVEA